VQARRSSFALVAAPEEKGVDEPAIVKPVLKYFNAVPRQEGRLDADLANRPGQSPDMLDSPLDRAGAVA
jgi:hypothetical protein